MAKVVKKGKSTGKPKKPSQKWMKYKIEGDKIIRARACPRCGPGIFLANTKDRLYCGKCQYTEFTGSKK